jgi:hypothetical protein
MVKTHSTARKEKRKNYPVVSIALPAHRYRRRFAKFTAVQKVNFARDNKMSRDVPVRATKKPKPSYNKLRFEVRPMASVIKTRTYMFKSLL